MLLTNEVSYKQTDKQKTNKQTNKHKQHNNTLPAIADFD